MVAVVVILAAVIGAFVLGLGGDQTTAPQAAFSYDAASDTLTMTGGDEIQADQISVEGNGWTGDSPVVAGSVMTEVTDSNDDGVITVSWTSADGSESAVLTTIEVGSGGSGGDGTQ